MVDNDDVVQEVLGVPGISKNISKTSTEKNELIVQVIFNIFSIYSHIFTCNMHHEFHVDTVDNNV